MRKIIGLVVLCFVFISNYGGNKDLVFNPFKQHNTLQKKKHFFRNYDHKADSQKKGAWKEKVTFGGSVSANFGAITFVLLNPQAIYMMNETTYIGAGPYFQYLRQATASGQRFSSSVYGATGFGRKYVREDLFLQVEYNQLFLQNVAGGARIPQGYGMIGGGYQPHPNISLTILYIFTKDPNGYAPFGGSPFVIRGGIIL